MQPSQGSLLLALAVSGAGAYALVHEAPRGPLPVADAPHQADRTDDFHDVHGFDHGTPTDEEQEDEDPSDDSGDVGPDREPPALEWSAPPSWRPLANPNAMRIATYRVAPVAGDASEAEVSVSRAGGDVDANVERWAEQFGGAVAKRRSSHAGGFDVTFVDIEGTYGGGMDPGASPRAGWALAAAIVKTPGQPYFFKVVGPAPTVRASRASLRALVQGIRSSDHRQ